MAQLNTKIMLSKLWLINPQRKMLKKIQMIQNDSTKISHWSRRDSNISTKRVNSRKEVQATLGVQNLHQNLLEDTSVSSAKSLDTSFRTALSRKLKFVLMGDMRPSIEAKARARTTTPMKKRKWRSLQEEGWPHFRILVKVFIKESFQVLQSQEYFSQGQGVHRQGDGFCRWETTPMGSLESLLRLRSARSWEERD